MSADSTILELFEQTRAQTLEIIESLSVEDLCVQPASFVSPIKWHIGHTTWIYEKTLQQVTSDPSFSEAYDLIFNSYYKGIGAHWAQAERGHLSRPTLNQVLDYKKYIDEKILTALEKSIVQKNDLRLAIEHEQQHQELIIMDLKYILSLGLGLVDELPQFKKFTLPTTVKTEDKHFSGGIHSFGHKGSSFCYDNELPYHDELLQDFTLQTELVTNGDYIEFLHSSAFDNSSAWLSDGYDWKNKNKISLPLYWIKEKDDYFTNFFGVKKPIDFNAPISHLSFYEADAYARFMGARLPTEFELELFFRESEQSPLWIWSSTSYHPYPGFKPFEGFAKEYNGKFMSGQMTLRGGCIATPKGHYRPSYRNFYRPTDRWQFSGIKLAKDKR